MDADPIESVLADLMLIDPRDLTFVTFRNAVPRGDSVVRATHQPSRIVVEATGPDALALRQQCVAEIRKRLADA